MEFFNRILIPVMLLITSIGLGACDNSTDMANSTAPLENPVAKPATENAAEVISISKPRIRATAPGQRVSGAFLKLTNSSDTSYALISASFDAAGMVEIHETSMDGEMMKMRQVSHIEIPANGSVELKQGSYHIMLMGLEKELIAGTTEALTLIFSDDSQKTVEASVGDLSK